MRRVMPAHSKAKGEMLPGTLDMLILQTLVLGPSHAHSIAHSIERQSDDILQVEHGSLYPALYRLEDRSWIPSFSGDVRNQSKSKVLPPHAGGAKTAGG